MHLSIFFSLKERRKFEKIALCFTCFLSDLLIHQSYDVPFSEIFVNVMQAGYE